MEDLFQIALTYYVEAHQLPPDWLWADAAPEAVEFMGNIPEYD